MKKLSIWALAVLTLFSCSKEEIVENPINQDSKAAVIKINVGANAPTGRAIEGGHPGVDDAEVNPKILTVTVIPYNEYGVEIGSVELNQNQIKEAINGNYFLGGNPVAGSNVSGATVGLPKGTYSVDVVINRPTYENNSAITNTTNINYFNRKDNKKTDGTTQDDSEKNNDNFDKTPLVSEFYGAGKRLSESVAAEGSMPVYTLDFGNLKPMLARFEVYGGINVKAPETFTDKRGNKWKNLSVAAYKTAITSSAFTTEEKAAAVTAADAGTTYKGVIIEAGKAFIPEYYWFKEEGASADELDRVDSGANKNIYDTEKEITDNADVKAGWVKCIFYANATATQVQWNPNQFYAVDVEHIYINNIKVRSSAHGNNLQGWPGADGGATTGWKPWHQAFHNGGWHTGGSSTGNTFLCMSNLWDQIIEIPAGTSANDIITVQFPAVNGQSELKLSKVKTTPLAGKGRYYATDHNIGVAADKAAAYQMYPQSTTLTADQDANKERIATSMPHIIAKVKCYDTAESYAAGKPIENKDFITVRLFKIASNSYVSNYKAGYIYRFDLNDLRDAFVGNSPVPGVSGKVDPTDPVDPDPEMPGSQVTVTLEVMPWKIQNIKPEI